MKQLKYIAHYQKDRNWGQINFVVTLAKKDILRIEQMSPETTAYKKPLFRRLDIHAPKQNTVALRRF